MRLWKAEAGIFRFVWQKYTSCLRLKTEVKTNKKIIPSCGSLFSINKWAQRTSCGAYSELPPPPPTPTTDDNNHNYDINLITKDNGAKVLNFLLFWITTVLNFFIFLFYTVLLSVFQTALMRDQILFKGCFDLEFSPAVSDLPPPPPPPPPHWV